MADLAFVKPDGTKVWVPEESASQAVEAGYKPDAPTPEEKARAEASDQPIVAGAEGLVRGLTAGFGEDVAIDYMRRIEGGTREDARKRALYRKEENPVISGVTEVGGMVAPALLSGGSTAAPQLLARGGATTARVAGRMALEGGVYGMGQVYSEATLENRPLHAENLAAGFIGGAGTGAGLGLLGKGLGKGVNAGVKALGGKALGETLENAGREAKWLNLGGQNRKLLAKEGLKDEIIDLADNLRIKDFSVDAVEQVKAHRVAELQPRYDKFLARLDDAAPLTPDTLGGLRDKVNANLSAQFGKQPTMDAAVKAAQDGMDALITRKPSWRDVHLHMRKMRDQKDDVGRAVYEEIENAFEDAAGGRFSSIDDDVTAVMRALEDDVSRTQRPVVGALPVRRVVEDVGGTRNMRAPRGAAEGTAVISPPQGSNEATALLPQAISPFTSLPEVRSGLPRGLSAFADLADSTVGGAKPRAIGGFADTVAGANAGLKAQFKKLNKEYAASLALEDAVSSRALALDSKGGPMMAAMRGAGGAVLGGLLGGPSGIVAGAGYQMAKEFAARKGGFILGDVLERMGPASAKMAKALEGRINTVAASGLLGKFTLPLTNAAALGTNELLAEHARIASGPEGDAYMAMLGLSPETPEELKGLGNKIALLEGIEAASKAHQDDLQRGVDGFFSSSPGPKATVKRASRDDFDTRVKQLEKLVVNPQTIFDAMPGEFMGVAPETMGLTAAKLAESAKFLYQKAPRSPWADKPPALQQPWEPSAADVEKWYRYVEGVESPRAVLEKLREGTATKEHLEAMQRVYPQMYEQLRQAMSDKLMEWKQPLPWEKRQVLAQLLGTNVFASAQQVSTLQQVHAKNRKKDGQQKGPDGRQQVNAEKNMATQSQRLEAR